MNDKSNTYLTILTKNSLFSFLGLMRVEIVDSDDQTKPVTAVIKMDPREEGPVFKEFDTSNLAVRSYEQAVNTSVERGWNVVYGGMPLKG